MKSSHAAISIIVGVISIILAIVRYNNRPSISDQMNDSNFMENIQNTARNMGLEPDFRLKVELLNVPISLDKIPNDIDDLFALESQYKDDAGNIYEIGRQDKFKLIKDDHYKKVKSHLEAIASGTENANESMAIMQLVLVTNANSLSPIKTYFYDFDGLQANMQFAKPFETMIFVKSFDGIAMDDYATIGYHEDMSDEDKSMRVDAVLDSITLNNNMVLLKTLPPEPDV